MNSFLRYTGAFVLLVALQLLIFNNIEFSGYVNPYVYVMFILILPVSIPSWILLLLGFLTGFVIDVFSGTMGVHTFATVLAGFVAHGCCHSTLPPKLPRMTCLPLPGEADCDGSWFIPLQWCWCITWLSSLWSCSASGISSTLC